MLSERRPLRRALIESISLSRLRDSDDMIDKRRGVLTKPFRNSKLHIRATMLLKTRGNFVKATMWLKTILVTITNALNSARSRRNLSSVAVISLRR